ALKTLPSVTINFQTWRHMEDSERLSIASRNLLTFWAHLESQCQKLELDMQNERESAAERAMQKRNKRGRPHLSLTQSMRAIQLDLRDLMRQVNFQASSSGDVSQTSTTTAASRKEQPKLTAEVSQPTRWVSRLEGYVILRDLERYLSRLARDYTLLKEDFTV
uniref:Ciliary neurotrophic factor n=1 Tax=Pygocentrus nattereri TaxID=42514 RepID=A0A3B4C3Z3_PYGNA